MKDGLYELNVDLVNYGKDIVMRKPFITYLSLQLVQSVGVDHHAAKEELYYYMQQKIMKLGSANGIHGSFLRKSM